MPGSPVTLGVRVHFEIFTQNRDEALLSTKPSVIQALIQGLTTRNGTTEAIEVLEACKGAQITFSRKTYTWLVSAAIQSGDPKAALGVFKDCQQAGYEPQLKVQCQLISALAKADRPYGQHLAQTAYDLWEKLFFSGHILDAAAYRAGMQACTASGRLGQARGLLDAMSAAGYPPDARAYNIILKGCSMGGTAGMDLVPAILASMQAAGVERSSVTYNTLVDAYVRAGRLGEAKQDGDLAGAHALLNQMKRLGVPCNVVTYTTLLDGYVKAGDLSGARLLWLDMRQSGVPPNAATFNTLLTGLAASPDPESLKDVFDLYGQMEVYKVRPTVDTYNTLLRACMRHGETKQAMTIFKRLRTSRRGPDVITYTTLINGFSDAGRPAAAVRAFEEMQADPNVKPDVACINSMVDALQRLGDMAAAESYLPEAARLAQEQGQPPPIEAYGAVIEGYAKQQDADAALAVLKAFFLLGGEADSRMYDIVVDVCVRTHKFQRALQVVKTMEQQGRTIDKERIKQRLEQMFSRQGRVRRQGRAAHRQHLAANENLERLKFWLGLENSYYG
ncbi:hypothetical protein WJX84_012366 [Apatococcus fuscideae]|uniref:Pentatricopeptide repeat-containing protein n=1 Tax=Apatococcus fuscideae TaxID=2026836 RepID=A0AAW1T8S7_9CHLO